VSLPDFLIVGAPKAGTSALHQALSGHPEIFLPSVKEPKFFLTDGPPPTSGGGPGDVATWGEHVWRRADYEALFDPAPSGARRGEATVFYLYDRDAKQRIADLLPEVRLVAVLRDPVERAHSNWSHLREAGLEPEADFLAACRAEDRRRDEGWAHFWHYVAQGRYGEQLDHLTGLIDPERILLLRYKELREEPVATADRVCAFLGVATGVVDAVPRHHVRPDVSGRSGAGPSPAERAALLPAFADDVARVEAHTGWDLDDWRR
jgi:hypothetical protein